MWAQTVANGTCWQGGHISHQQRLLRGYTAVHSAMGGSWRHGFCPRARRSCLRSLWMVPPGTQFGKVPHERDFVSTLCLQTDAVSINHNTMNACNIDHVAKLVLKRLADVKAAIDDVRGVFSEEEFFDQCQVKRLSNSTVSFPIRLDNSASRLAHQHPIDDEPCRSHHELTISAGLSRGQLQHSR